MKPPANNVSGGINSPYRSWGEEQIARLLDRNRIDYKYEYPVAVIDREKVRLLYPDFTLPGYGVIIEYFGVNGDAGYDEQKRHKIHLYEQAGIKGLFLTRDSFRGDWPFRIMYRIEDILKDRLDKFHHRYRHVSSK